MKCELCNHPIEEAVNDRMVVGSGTEIARRIAVCDVCYDLIQQISAGAGVQCASVADFLERIDEHAKVN